MLKSPRRTVLGLLIAAALTGAIAGIAAAQKGAAPVNQAPRDPALVKVIAAMLAAAKAKDFEALAPHLSERVRLDFGGGSGRAEFGRRLVRNAALWEELVWVLEHGGRFQRDGSFWAPYTFAADTGKLDAFEAGVLVRKASAHSEPRAGAAVAAELERSVVRVLDWKRSERTPSPFYRRDDWVQIELADKRKAWLPAKYVRATVDYRAGFAKLRGTWKLTAFIAGD